MQHESDQAGQEAQVAAGAGAGGDGRRHPIDELMHTAMDSLKSMVDVNTILGVPVEAPDGTVIIPVSRVSFGFVAGGSEFETSDRQHAFPFGGGSGAGVSLSPVAFLVVAKGQVRLLPVSERAIYDRLLDMAPRVLEHLQHWAGQREHDGHASPPERLARSTSDGRAADESNPERGRTRESPRGSLEFE